MTGSIDLSTIHYGPDGLVVAVVQDVRDGRVLMVGWMDAEALAATVKTGDVHFHSRSRGRLWRKGETSGNSLRLVDLALDCDRDAILVTADPSGPTCHQGTRSCFDPATEAATPATATAGFGWLDALWRTIHQRLVDRPAGSYTTKLANGGVDATSRKVAEESIELVLAAKDDAAAEATGADRDETRAALAAELADLLYHALVLAAERGLPAAEVMTVLRDRHRPG